MPILVIARFSTSRVSIWIALNLALFILAFAGVARHPAGISLQDHLLSGNGLYDPLAILALVAIPLLAIVISAMLRQMIFRDRTAIWIAKDDLFFLNFYGAVTFSSLPLKNVDHFAIGSKRLFQPTGIIAHLRDGTRQYVPTILLSEPRRSIMVQLTTALSR
jgi:hypothetical protein